MTRIFAIEGIDRLGKSRLIDGIQHRLGFHQVIHFGKPRLLDVYSEREDVVADPPRALYLYQKQAFIESMILTQSRAHIIFDRWHLGEAVYAPLYRHYSGDYVFELERQYLSFDGGVRLILLTENFENSNHFVSDGDSFDDTKRRAEQELFLQAFKKSNVLDKRKICVTDPITGGFRKPADILEEALK